MAITHVLPQNTGTIAATTYSNPAAVPNGVVAAFNAETGVGIDITSAAPAGVAIRLVLGGEQPIITAPFVVAEANVSKQAYVAPSVQSVAIPVPVGPSGGSYFNVKVRVIRALSDTEYTVDGAEPFPTQNFEVKVGDSESKESIIDKFMPLINRTDVQYPYKAKSNKVDTVTLTGTSGTANITLEGVDYLATFNSDLDTTAADFVSTHGATILADHGVTVSTTATDDVIFTATNGNFVSPTIANATGDLAGSVAATTAAGNLVIEGKNAKVIFVVGYEGTGFTPTLSITDGVEGSGDGATLTEVENQTRGTYSKYYQDTNLLEAAGAAITNNVSATGQYDVYTVNAPNDYDRSINKSFQASEILVALEDATTGDFDTFFGV